VRHVVLSCWPAPTRAVCACLPPVKPEF
jgi:hypothetical protein